MRVTAVFTITSRGFRLPLLARRISPELSCAGSCTWQPQSCYSFIVLQHWSASTDEYLSSFRCFNCGLLKRLILTATLFHWYTVIASRWRDSFFWHNNKFQFTDKRDHFTVRSLFSARQHMHSALLSPVRLSVWPSVRPSHGWISQKRLKLGLWNFHRTVAPCFKFLRNKFYPEILTGSPRTEASNKGGVEKQAIF